MSFLVKNSDHILLHIKATPNSAKTKIGEIFRDEKNQEYLKVNIAAIAQDGEANEAVIKFFAKLLKIPKSKIEILRGENSRTKTIKILTLENLTESDFKSLK